MKKPLCCAFALSACITASHAADAPLYTAIDGNKVDAATFEGWRAVRQLDCARCHGAKFDGSSGPSLLESVRARTKQDFVRIVLDGAAERGMPPYRTIARIADNIDGLYAYFKALADGAVRPGVLTSIE